MGTWFAALKKAFIYHWNLLFVGVTGALAALSGRPDVVLPLAGAAEIGYLALLSTNARFQKLAAATALPAKAGAGETDDELLPSLAPADRARYQHLRDLCLKLRRLAAGEPGQEALGIPDLQLENIDRLLRIYRRLLAMKNTLERFFAAVDPDELQRSLERARGRLAALAAEGGDPARSEKHRGALRDTVATNEMRLANYRKAKENHEYVLLELERLHTKIAGIAELGIDRQGAAAVGREIDFVASSVQDTERTMREIEGLALTEWGDALAPAGARRRRARNPQRQA